MDSAERNHQQHYKAACTEGWGSVDHPGCSGGGHWAWGGPAKVIVVCGMPGCGGEDVHGVVVEEALFDYVIRMVSTSCNGMRLGGNSRHLFFFQLAAYLRCSLISFLISYGGGHEHVARVILSRLNVLPVATESR
jgi:hypothetical protein